MSVFNDSTNLTDAHLSCSLLMSVVLWNWSQLLPLIKALSLGHGVQSFHCGHCADIN